MQLNYFSIWRKYFMNQLDIWEYSFEKRVDLVEWFSSHYKVSEDLMTLLEEMPFVNVFSIIPNIFSKEEKVQLLKQNHFDEKVRCYMIKTLSDEEKELFLPDITDQNLQAEIISSFSQDNLKKTYLKEIDGKYRRLIIIKSYQNDNRKENHLQEFELHDQIELIISFHTDELKEKYLRKIKEPSYRVRIIYYLQSDKKKLEYLKREKFSFMDQLSIIVSLQSDDLKLSFLPQMLSSMYRKRLLESLKTDFGRIKALEQIQNLSERDFMIDRIEDPYLRNHYLPNNQKIKDIAFIKNNTCMTYSISGFDSLLLPEEMTFGIELEMIGNKADNLLSLNNRKLLKRWDIKTEDLGLNGLEITSPILHYQYSDMNELYNVCAFLKKNDFNVTPRCAGHIHVGAHTLDTIESFKMFYYLYLNCEKILYLISNEPNTLPRDGIMKYAKPISSDLIEYIKKENVNWKDIEDRDTFIKEIQKFQLGNDFEGGRYRGVNILNMNGGGKNKNTIEFRFPNGSLDPNIIHQNMKLFGRLILLAKELTQTKINKETKKSLSVLSSSSKEIEKVKVLLELLFEDLEDQMIFLERYLKNSTLLKENDSLNQVDFPPIKRI